MYTRLQTTRQQYGGSLIAIDNWLEERQQLIVAYCKLAALPPFDKGQSTRKLPFESEILEFCQILMDYLSAGHFEVYDQIVSQCSVNGSSGKALAERLYPQIATSTDIALEFNDRYADHAVESRVSEFDLELSKLGQALMQRFDLEDELIQTLHDRHSDAAATA